MMALVHTCKQVNPNSNKVVGDCKDCSPAIHPYRRAVRTPISVGLLKYVADPCDMADAMNQTSGYRIIV